LSDLTNELSVDIGAIERLEVLTIDQWWKRRILLSLVDDRVETEMLLRDTFVLDVVCAILI